MTDEVVPERDPAINAADRGCAVDPKPLEVECPKCGHKFFHKIKEALKGAGESLGNAIGEAKFGGDG
jgi:hypothetical protein